MISRVTSLPAPPLPLLVTGIAGVAGYNAFHYFRAKYGSQVLGIRPANNWRLHGPGIVACNAEDVRGLARLFDRYQFAAVLSCAGSCALKHCELDPEMAYRVNVTGLRALLTAVARARLRLVHLSIDLVFSGAGSGDYREHDRTDPVTVYGKTMSIAEELLALADPAHSILRISLPMGRSFNGHAGAIDWIMNRFRQSKPATLYFDEIRTPTYTDCLNRVCQAVLASRLRGIYHAGGPRRLSLYQIGQIINRVGGCDPRLLMGCYRAQAGPVPPRAGNVSLNSTKLEEALGFAPFDPWPYEDGLVPTHPDWHWDRRSGDVGSPRRLAQLLYDNPGCPDRMGRPPAARSRLKRPA